MAPFPTATRCARCRALLQRPENGSIDTAIALAICALELFLLTNAYPLGGIQYNGPSRDTTVIGAALSLYRQDHTFLACLVFITTVLSPFLQLAGPLYLLLPLRPARQAAGLGTVF